MVTRLNQSEFVKTALRLPPEVHAQIHEAAAESGRSYNAELIARLQRSFEHDGLEDQLRLAEYKIQKLTQLEPSDGDVKLSPAVRAMVEQVAEKNQLTLGDALATLALAGYAKGGPAVVYFAAEPSFNLGSYVELFKTIDKHLAPDTTILIEQSGMRVQVRPTAPEIGPTPARRPKK